MIMTVLSAEGEGRGWSNNFFFLPSALQQIVETPCTPKQDTVCGCQKNQYQIDSESEYFQCRNCSSCADGIIASCEYGSTGYGAVHWSCGYGSSADVL